MDCFEAAHESDFKAIKTDQFVSVEKGHGRQEERTVIVIYDPEALSTKEESTGLKSVIQVLSKRRVGEKESDEVAYYIRSSEASAQVLAEGIRAHWGIENGQHWCLDVLFGEDRNQTEQRYAAENLAWLRKMALSLFRHDGTKGSIPKKRFRAALDDQYRLDLLHMPGKQYA